MLGWQNGFPTELYLGNLYVMLFTIWTLTMVYVFVTHRQPFLELIGFQKLV